MVSLIKSIIGIKNEDDNIPEIVLQKNEPKVTWDPVRRRYIIEGEPIEEEKPKLPPPKMTKKQINATTTSSSHNKPMKRYANVFGDENIISTPEPQQSQPLSSVSPQHEHEEPKPSPLEPIEDDTKNVNGNTPEMKDDLISEIENKDEIAMSFLPDALNLQNGVQGISIEAHEAEIEKLKNEYNGKLQSIQEEHLTEVNELKEHIQFNNDDSEDKIKLLKEQINKFISENVELKLQHEQHEDTINTQRNEIDRLEKVITRYKEFIGNQKQNNNEDETAITNVNKDDEQSSNNELVLMRTRLTSLESEKLILNNDIIELTSANETMKQEYQQLQHKVKGYEMQVEKLRKEIQSYTLIIKEQTSTIKTFESQVNAKNNKVIQLEKQIEKDNSMIETLNKEVNSVNVTNDEMKLMLNKTQSELELIRNNSDELKKQLVEKESKLKQGEQLVNEMQNEIATLNKNNQFTLANVTKEKNNMNKRIQELIKDNTYLKQKITSLITTTANKTNYNITNNNNYIQYTTLYQDETQKNRNLTTQNFNYKQQIQTYTSCLERIYTFISSTLSNKSNIIAQYPNINVFRSFDNNAINNYDRHICNFILYLLSTLSEMQTQIETLSKEQQYLYNNEPNSNALKILLSKLNKTKHIINNNNNTIHALSNEVKNLSSQLHDMQSLQSQMKSTETTLQQTIISKDKEITALNDTITSLQNKVNSLTTECNDIKRLQEGIVNQKEETQKETELLVEQLEKAVIEINDNKQRIEELVNNNNNLTEQNKELNEYVLQIENDSKQKDDKIKEITVLKEKLTLIEGENEKLNITIQELAQVLEAQDEKEEKQLISIATNTDIKENGVHKGMNTEIRKNEVNRVWSFEKKAIDKKVNVVQQRIQNVSLQYNGMKGRKEETERNVVVKEEQKENTMMQQKKVVQQPPPQRGFFSRIIAPIFLTEDELNNTTQSTSNSGGNSDPNQMDI